MAIITNREREMDIKADRLIFREKVYVRVCVNVSICIRVDVFKIRMCHMKRGRKKIRNFDCHDIDIEVL